MLVALILVALAIIVIFGLCRSRRNEREHEQRAARMREIDERRVRAEKKRDEYVAGLSKQWITADCHVNGWAAVLGLRRDFSMICIFPFRVGYEFRLGRKIVVPIGEIVGIHVHRAEVKETFYRTEIVPTSIKRNRSPVTRAVAGGLVFGPVGAVIGAASGLNGRAVIESEERKVSDTRVVQAKPTLVVSTTIHEHSKLDIHDIDAEYWYQLIQGAAARIR